MRKAIEALKSISADKIKSGKEALSGDSDFEVKSDIPEDIKNLPMEICKYVCSESEPLWQFTYITYKQYKNLILDTQTNLTTEEEISLIKKSFIDSLTIDDYNDFLYEAKDTLDRTIKDVYEYAIENASKSLVLQVDESTSLRKRQKVFFKKLIGEYFLTSTISRSEELLYYLRTPRNRINIFLRNMLTSLLAALIFAILCALFLKHFDLLIKIAEQGVPN